MIVGADAISGFARPLLLAEQDISEASEPSLCMYRYAVYLFHMHALTIIIIQCCCTASFGRDGSIKTRLAPGGSHRWSRFNASTDSHTMQEVSGSPRNHW